MAKSILWVIGPPRSGSTFLSVFLQKCNCDPAVIVPLTSNDWNTEWAECAWLHYYAGALLGRDEITGLWKTQRPESFDPIILGEFQKYLRERLEVANGTYLLKANFAPFIMPEMMAAFPEDTVHKMVISKRNEKSIRDSLQERCQSKDDKINTYIHECHKEIENVNNHHCDCFQKIKTMDFDEVIKDCRKTLELCLEELDLTPSEEAWEIFDPKKVRF